MHPQLKRRRQFLIKLQYMPLQRRKIRNKVKKNVNKGFGIHTLHIKILMYYYNIYNYGKCCVLGYVPVHAYLHLTSEFSQYCRLMNKSQKHLLKHNEIMNGIE